MMGLHRLPWRPDEWRHEWRRHLVLQVGVNASESKERKVVVETAMAHASYTFIKKD
jgi:hypothetical protein